MDKPSGQLSPIKMSQPAAPSTPCHKRGIKRTFKQRKSPHNQQIHQQQQQQQQYFDDLSDSDSDIPTDYIDNMLEEGLKESLGKSALPSHEERKKIVLKKREQDYFEMLPESKCDRLLLGERLEFSLAQTLANQSPKLARLDRDHAPLRNASLPAQVVPGLHTGQTVLPRFGQHAKARDTGVGNTVPGVPERTGEREGVYQRH